MSRRISRSRYRSRSPSPVSKFKTKIREASRARFRRRTGVNLPPVKRWGKPVPSNFTRGFTDGRFFYGGRGYGYPLWLYYGLYYPWWYAYHIGFMPTPMYTRFVQEYGLPPAEYSGPTAPADLNQRNALVIRSELMNDFLSCDVCGVTSEETQLHHCADCQEAIYCGEECQAHDYEMHKKEC
jgi:hypothetical protein